MTGTSFKAFQLQSTKCEVAKGSCLRNQILDILKKEITKKNDGLSTDYLVSEIGDFVGLTKPKEINQNENPSSRSMYKFF